jgi:hypothetical protein
MSLDEVVALKGQPQAMYGNLAAKLIYVYDAIMLIFNNGKVTDIQ